MASHDDIVLEAATEDKPPSIGAVAAAVLAAGILAGGFALVTRSGIGRSKGRGRSGKRGR